MKHPLLSAVLLAALTVAIDLPCVRAQTASDPQSWDAGLETSGPGPSTYHWAQTDRSAFGDPAASRWIFERTASGCELRRTVNGYGVARFFVRTSGGAGNAAGSLRFELAAPSGLLLQTPVSLLRDAPPWHPQHPHSQTLGRLATIDGYGVWGDAPRARQMLMDLYNGFDQVLYADGAYTANAMLKVRLAADHFRAGYRRFDACLRSGNPRHGFAQLDRTRVHFPTNGHVLDAAGRARVERVARLARADKSVQRLYVDGHTDATGGERHNVALSRRRAEAVVAHLKALGVAADRIVMRYHAHRYPVADNATAKGKHANRRTTIRLERADAQLAQR